MIWGYGGLILVRISQYILIVYHVPGLILSALWALVHLTLTKLHRVSAVITLFY